MYIIFKWLLEKLTKTKTKMIFITNISLCIQWNLAVNNRPFQRRSLKEQASCMVKHIGCSRTERWIGRIVSTWFHARTCERTLGRSHCRRCSTSGRSDARNGRRTCCSKSSLQTQPMRVGQEGLLSLTAQRAACETWNADPSYSGSLPLGPNFTGTGSSPAKMLILFERQLTALQLCHWKFFRQRNFVADF